MTSPSTMKKIVVPQFGGVEVLQIVELPLPEPAVSQVRVRLTSIGMNHADLMARRGEYRISSGDPPFSPGLEAGGVIDAVGPGVTDRRIGQRVVIGPDAPRRAVATPSGGEGGGGGTYGSHYICEAGKTFVAPDAVPNEQLGAFWLTYLTAWGCLIWKHGLRQGEFVVLPAASSGVALAAAQIVKKHGGVAIGLTTSAGKVAKLRALPGCGFDHLVLTKDAAGNPTPWHKDLKRITTDHGVDVFFDPVAAGVYLDSEIRCLAQFGTVYVYGLLGQPGKVDVTPLIRKHASIRGWALAELVAAGPTTFAPGCRHILAGFADGSYRQHIDQVFKLDDVQAAQKYMEEGKHIGKLVLAP